MLILDGKLLRCQLNVQILTSDYFSDQNTQIFPGPVNARFPVIPNYSKSSEGSTSHFNLKVNLLNSRMLKNTRRATGKLPGSFREVLTKKLRFQKKKHFCRSNENLSVIRTFAQGIDWEQRRHFWIAFAMVLNGKLLRTQTNSQILSYDHFSGQNTQNLGPAVNCQPSFLRG